MKKDKEQKEPVSFINESFTNKKWFSVLMISINALTVGFCAFALTPLLYCFAYTTVSLEIATTLFSIDWTVFGIFIAVAGMMVAIKQNKNIKVVDKFFKAELLIIIINSLVSCFMLLVTSYFIFSGNEKLFISATFATLYLLCIVFVNYVFLLAVFVADEWLFNKTDAD